MALRRELFDPSDPWSSLNNKDASLREQHYEIEAYARATPPVMRQRFFGHLSSKRHK